MLVLGVCSRVRAVLMLTNQFVICIGCVVCMSLGDWVGGPEVVIAVGLEGFPEMGLVVLRGHFWKQLIIINNPE